MATNSDHGNKSVFTPAEIAYLQSQQLCRIATADPNGQPYVTPVGFRYNLETDTFDIGGYGGFARRKKWQNVQENPQVAIVIDDVASVDPWTVRGIEIRGVVETLPTGGETIHPGADPEMFHITPKRIVSWGLDGDAYGPSNARSVN